MILNDDQNSAKIGDRIIAALIGGLCGFFIGLVFDIIQRKLLGGNLPIQWILSLGCAVFAFIAPAKSTSIWSAFWEELLGFLSSRK